MNTTEFVIDGWRDETVNPELKNVVSAKLAQRHKSQRRGILAFGFLATGASAAILSAVLLLGGSTLTLAQVVAAGSKVDSYTVTNRRIMGVDKGNGFSLIKRVSGDAYSQTFKGALPRKDDGTFGYVDSHSSISYWAQFKVAFLDSRERSTDAYRRIPEISTMLKDFKASKVEQGYEYEGRKVTRFTFKRKVHDYDIDQELLADPKTNLPIKFTSMRDNRSWGDEWSFDYTPIDRASIKPEIPPETKIIDLVPQRKHLVDVLSRSSGPIPTFLSSPLHETVFIVKKSEVKNQQFMMFKAEVKSKLTGKTKHFHGTEMFQSGQNEFKIGSQEYVCVRLQTEEDRDGNAFAASDALTGSITEEGFRFKKTTRFSDVRGTEVGVVHSILAPFRIPGKPQKLGYQGQ